MIPFVREFDFAYGRCDRLTPLIRRVVANNPGPFTFTGTGTYLIGYEGAGRGVAVIDPGPLDDAHLAALLAAVDGQSVSHVLVTHTHLDHAPLARPFADSVGAPVLAAHPPEVGPGAGLEEGEDAAFRPDVILTGDQPIVGDGWTLDAVATPGHMSNHMAFRLREERALFSGDHIMGWSTTVVAPPDGDMADYMASLDAVIRMAPETIWPTHGPPITEPAPFLAAYRDHRLEREAQIMGRLAAGDLRISDIVPALYHAVDQRLWPAASLSVLAHLIALEKTGRVRADPAPAMDAAWRLL
jgi:glyoxylase-like metal-dependent hydrolase (beta-lactamase superfamily II)